MVGRPRSYASVWQQGTFFRDGRELAPFPDRIKDRRRRGAYEL